jgi:methyltransferase
VVTQYLYLAFIVLLGVERLVELTISRRNRSWALSQGGLVYGREHLPWMKLLHTGFLLGCALEVWALSRPFLPLLGWPCLALALCCQGLRYWAIGSLGRRWNIEVIVLPGVPAEVSGPFRFLRHPNYLAVVLEGVVVPLIHSAWLTALTFTVLNALLLRVRIRCEERALAQHCQYDSQLGARPRFLPGRADSSPPSRLVSVGSPCSCSSRARACPSRRVARA